MPLILLLLTGSHPPIKRLQTPLRSSIHFYFFFKKSTKKSDMNKNVCGLVYFIKTLFKSHIVKKSRKEMFILRHNLVVLFLSKIVIRSKSIPDRTVDLNLLKMVVWQTLLVFERFSSEYHLIQEMLSNRIKYPSSHPHHDLFWYVYLSIILM